MPICKLRDGEWLNPPPDWRIDGNKVCVTTGATTDFWRRTHYGFIRDNGHFLGLPAPDAFTATISFEADYERMYDQAGLMLRVDEKNWLKLGIEHSDGMTNFSIVVTRDNSDWSVVPQPLVSGPQTVRLTRHDGAIIAHFRNAAGRWQLMRVAEFPDFAARIGPMTCTPERHGLIATFFDLNITTPMENALHG